jgi:perosamine synthetase
VAERIPLHEPVFEGNEWRYVKECLDSGWVSSAGPFVEQFEDSIKAYTGAKYAVACVNGSAALQVALRAAGVGLGHEVIVPTLTFIASVNAIHHCGAHPVFIDSDEFFNLDIQKTAEFLETHTELREDGCWNKSTNRKIVAILPVHVFGNAARLDPLLDICQAASIALVEDAAESLGTVYTEGRLSGRHTGTIGVAGCLSFNGNKIITAGGGGVILTGDQGLASQARYLTTQAKDDPTRYLHGDAGYNFRLSNIHAAVGLAQLEQLPGILAKKANVFSMYKDSTERIEGLTVANTPDYAKNNHWLNILQVGPGFPQSGIEQILFEQRRRGIGLRPIWALNHEQLPYQNCISYDIVNAPNQILNSLCLPSSASLKLEEIRSIFEDYL